MGYRTPILKNVSMDWETEQHSFTFVTLGDKLDALDSLRALRRSLDDLYRHILEGYDFEGDIPYTIKVKGGLYGAFSFEGEPTKKNNKQFAG